MENTCRALLVIPYTLLAAGRLAITLDDGCSDKLDAAKVYAALEIPPTIFNVLRSFQRHQSCRWDSTQRVVLRFIDEPEGDGSPRVDLSQL